MDIIPAIDLLGGRCVRLYQGDFEQVTHYDTDPIELARQYRKAGAEALHVVDLDGARSGTATNHPVITQLAAESGLAVQAGGGIRTLESAQRLISAGARRIVIGSVAVTETETACRWLETLGADRLVIGLDVRRDTTTGDFSAQAHGWRKGSGRSLWSLAEQFAAAGARHVLCTDIGRDGTLAGPNCELYAECVRRFPALAWIASGGVSGAADLASLAQTGVAAVVTGKALLDGRLSIEEIREFSRAG